MHRNTWQKYGHAIKYSLGDVEANTGVELFAFCIWNSLKALFSGRIKYSTSEKKEIKFSIDPK